MFGLAALAYAGLAISVWFFQSRFIYFPDEPSRRLDATPNDAGLTYSEVQFKTNDGVLLHGWFVPNRDGPVLLYFHGNAGNISHRLETIHLFHQLGLNVFIIDYRGYGHSEGKPSEQGSYRDALAAWNYLTQDQGIDPQRIVIFGRSLGGAIAAWLAVEVSPQALILESTFSSVRDMARIAFPYLPAGLARIQYDTVSRIASITCPILLMHSPQDEIIPFELSQKLLAAAPGQTTFFSLQGGHNDAHVVSGAAYASALSHFIEQTR